MTKTKSIINWSGVSEALGFSKQAIRDDGSAAHEEKRKQLKAFEKKFINEWKEK